jgi:hypothetical protein
MKTARWVIETAFRQILAENADSPLSADEYADALDALNLWVASQEALGMRLGYTPIQHVTDYVTVPDGALRGLAANLAIDLAAQFDMPVSPSLATQAQQGIDAMLRLGVRQISSSMPRTLPHGSGNTEPTWRTTPFYGDVARCEIAFTNNGIPTTFSALNSPVRVNGNYVTVAATNLRGDVDGKITNTSSRVRRLDYKAVLTVFGAGDYIMSVYRNGSELIDSLLLAVSGVHEGSILGTVMLAPQDFVEMRIEADSVTDPITVTDARLTVD